MHKYKYNLLFICRYFAMPKRKLVSSCETQGETIVDSPSKSRGQGLHSLPIALRNEIINAPVTKGGWTVADAVEHLIKSDMKFKDVIVNLGMPSLFTNHTQSSTYNDSFHDLIQTIVYQQLAGNVAETIFVKVTSALEVKPGRPVTPTDVLKANFTVEFVDNKKKVMINGVPSGLSEAKATYMKSLAEHFSDPSKLKDADFSSMDDETLISKLTAVKGLGLWSVHMFMIFKLQRPNVLAVGDLGVRNAAASFFQVPRAGLQGRSGEAKLLQLCRSWAPYSTMAVGLMWKIADAEKQSAKLKGRNA